MDASPDRVARIQAEWRRERPELDPSPQGVIGRLHRGGSDVWLEPKLVTLFR